MVGGLAVDATTLGLIAIFVLLLLNLTLTFLMLRIGVFKIENTVRQNAEELAMTLQQTVDMLPIDLEGANPIQMAIASWIGEQAKARSNIIETTIVPRNEKGEFSAKDISL